MKSQIDVEKIEAIRHDFSQQWRTGERPSIESALPRYQGGHWRLMLTTLLSMEVRLRRELGEVPTKDEYVDRFPGMDAYVRLAFGERSVPHLFPSEWMRWFMRPAPFRPDASSSQA